MGKSLPAVGFGVAVVLVGLHAHATTTTCSDADLNRYGYGRKAEMRFEVNKGDLDALTPVFQNYAAQMGLSYSSAGMNDPTKGLKTLTHILQSKSFDVSINIDTDNRRNTATANISTFSYSCGPITDNWKPYWRAFKVFLKQKHFKRLPAQFTPPE